MKLTRPAFINAFFCPGFGHITAGWWVTGSLLAMTAVTSVMSPFLAFMWGLLKRPECYEGIGACTKEMVAHAWSYTWVPLLIGVPTFLVVYVVALIHGNTLTIPERSS